MISVATAVFGLLYAVSGNDWSGSEAGPYDTIVVGLGAAGCAAAGTLAQAGHRVLALEAQGRVGGRVNSVPFSDGTVELGAEWIHGTESSRTYDLAVAHNVSLASQDVSFTVYRSDGTLADRELIAEFVDFALDVSGDHPDVPGPLGQYVTKRLMAYIGEMYPALLNDKEFIDEYLQFMDLIIDTYLASSNWNDVTTGSKYQDLGGDKYASWHRHGYKTLFEILLNTYNNGTGYPTLETKLNAEVTQISWSRTPSTLVRVTCRDGRTYAAHNVIVTVSLGVLKEKHTSLFTPQISQEKITAIEKISMGLLGKVILSFDERWWTGTDTIHTFFWTTKDKRAVPASDIWTTEIVALSTPLGCSNAITLWTTGDVAKLVETLPEDVVIEKSMALIRKFMGTNMTIPDPTAMIRSNWQSNPFTRGSYTYDNLLTPQYPNARADLSEPLLDAAGRARVLFAGEASNPTHYSTVHGAAETGYREAMRLLPATTKS